MNNPYKQYKKTQIDTADQGKLIIMLYDGAIKFINTAIDLMPGNEIDPKDMETIHKNIVKAQDIVSELMTSLNMEVGEISQRLFGIYMYMHNRLIEANINKSQEPLIEIRKYLLELREAWYEAAKNAPQETLKSKETGGINIAT